MRHLTVPSGGGSFANATVWPLKELQFFALQPLSGTSKRRAGCEETQP